MFKFSLSDSTVRPVHERTLAANLFATVDSPQCLRGGSIFIAGNLFYCIVSVLCCADSTHINFHRRFEHTLSIILRTFCFLVNKFNVNLNFFAVEASAVHQRLQMQAANSRSRPRNSRNSSPQKTVGTCQRSKMSSWPDPRRSDVLKQNT